jgi:hypothetical protein
MFSIILQKKAMEDIIYLALLGLFAGSIASLWTRIIKSNMILFKIGKRLNKADEKYRITTGMASPWVKFVRCIFCLTPWLCLVFDVAYIAYYTPNLLFCVIGVLASLGAGNFVAEIVYSLRNENL